jgi:hypothetical protein
MEGFEPGSSVPEADVTPPGQYRDLVSVNLRNFTSDKVDRKNILGSEKSLKKKQFESDKMNEKTMKDKKNWSPKEES